MVSQKYFSIPNDSYIFNRTEPSMTEIKILYIIVKSLRSECYNLGNKHHTSPWPDCNESLKYSYTHGW